MNRRFLVAVGITLCASVLACDIQDVSPLLVTQSDGGEAGSSWAQPYLGNIGVAWRLTWTEPAPDSVEILWQARTSGRPEAEACRALQNLSGTPVVLRPGSSTATNPSTPEIALEPGARALEGTQGAEDDPFELRLRSASRGQWRLTFRGLRNDPQLTQLDGVPILLEELPIEDPDCADTRRFEMVVEAGTYVLRLGQQNLSGGLHLERPCQEVRTVPATCPGHVGPAVSRRIEGGIDDARSGWVSPVELGAGDIIAVAIRCAPDARCALRLEQSHSLEPLACRTSGDCGSGGTCTQEGRCLEGGGCSMVAGKPSPAGLAMLVALLLVLRRRKGASNLILALVLVPVAVSFAPSQSIARDGPRLSDTRQVVLHTGAGQRRIVGQGRNEIDPGLTLVLGHGLQFGRVGFLLEASLDSALVQGQSPPRERGLQLTSFTLTPRTALSWRDFRLLGGPSWLRTSPLVNAAPRLLGSRRHHHGVGAHTSLRLEHLSPLYVEGVAEYHALLTTPSAVHLLGLRLNVGIAGTF